MRDAKLTVLENREIAKDVYKMTLSGITPEDNIRPGQFVNVRITGKYLRRPISVHDFRDNTLSLIYKIVGEGTGIMSTARLGDKLSVLLPLGNGYTPEKSGDTPLLIGGGVGVPPLYALAKQLRGEGKTVKVILGFNTEEECFGEAEFRNLGCEVILCTVDGTAGIQGFVTDALPQMGEYTYFFTCGPEPMLKAVYKATKTSGQFSFEERMGCGFGACMGCSCKTVTGWKRICKEGPVLEKEEILW